MKVPISETRSAISRLRNIGTRSGRPNPAEFRTAKSFSVSVANRVRPPFAIRCQPNIIEEKSNVQAPGVSLGVTARDAYWPESKQVTGIIRTRADHRFCRANSAQHQPLNISRLAGFLVAFNHHRA